MAMGEIIDRASSSNDPSISKDRCITCDVNPFYRATLDQVKDNIEFANKIYPKVFLRFANEHVKRTGELPPKELATLCLS